mgnify:FL=1
MITIQVTRAEAILIMDLLQKFYAKSIENIDIAINDEVRKEAIGSLLNIEAPYGLKKDGTPKAQPGRKTANKGKK